MSHSIRHALQSELAARCQKNARYSLRAFSKMLGISHSQLSRMMKGQRAITPAMQAKLASILGVDPSPPEQLDRLHLLQEDAFCAISDWYHDAILELPRLKSFRPDHAWIARALGISIHEVNSAVDRLKRLKLLSINAKGMWKVLLENSTNILKPGHSTRAAQKYQKQILEKAALALETCPAEERDHTSVTMAICAEDFPQLRAITRKYRRDLIAMAQRKGVKPDRVYQLQISLFPLSEKLKGEEL